MMRLSVVVLVALAAVAQALPDHSKPTRLRASAMRIARLGDEIQELAHEIQEAEKIDPFGFILEMHDKLNDVEGKQ